MDFLFMTLLYLAAWIAGFLVYIATRFFPDLFDKWPLRHIKGTFNVILELLHCCLPQSVLVSCHSIYIEVFFKRNHIFQAFYVFLVATGHGILLLDALPFLHKLDPGTDHFRLPVGLLAVNVILFVISSYSDPGRITDKNVDQYLNTFLYDGVLYKEKQRCSTCLSYKPARSKHCAIADECILKFDHYCAWTSNSVGAFNHRYFIAFLISICAMSANGAAMAATALGHVTNVYQLWQLQYLDSSGRRHPMTFSVLFQTLFMQYPRLVFLAVALTTVSTLLSLFTFYHFFLVATNQTTNERYKRSYLRKAGIKPPENIYNQGFIQNIKESLFPYHYFRKSSKLHFSRKKR